MDFEKAARAFCASLAADLLVQYEKNTAALRAEYEEKAEKMKQEHEAALAEMTGENSMAYMAQYLAPKSGASNSTSTSNSATPTATAPKRRDPPTPGLDGADERMDKRPRIPSCDTSDEGMQNQPKRTARPSVGRESIEGFATEQHPANKIITAKISHQKPLVLPSTTPLEVRFCATILEALRQPALHEINSPFVKSVPVGEYPDYYNIVSKPMDLGTMAVKLEVGKYKTAEEFKRDFELMIANCNAYNPVGHPVRDCGIRLRRHFEECWNSKERWMQTTLRSPLGGTGDAPRLNPLDYLARPTTSAGREKEDRKNLELAQAGVQQQRSTRRQSREKGKA